MALSASDRALLQHCLQKDPGAWNDFVDRFLGLIYHVIEYTAHLRSIPTSPEDREDIAAEVLLQIVSNDYAVLRQFRMASSLATYLTVITRRIAIHELTRRSTTAPPRTGERVEQEPADKRETHASMENKEELDRLLSELPTRERQLARMRFMEGRSYEEISAAMKIPVHTIGPLLSRLKRKLQEMAAAPNVASRKAAAKARPRPKNAATTTTTPHAIVPQVPTGLPDVKPVHPGQLKSSDVASSATPTNQPPVPGRPE